MHSLTLCKCVHTIHAHIYTYIHIYSMHRHMHAYMLVHAFTQVLEFVHAIHTHVYVVGPVHLLACTLHIHMLVYIYAHSTHTRTHVERMCTTCARGISQGGAQDSCNTCMYSHTIMRIHCTRMYSHTFVHTRTRTFRGCAQLLHAAFPDGARSS